MILTIFTLQIKSWILWKLIPYIKNETIFLAVFRFFCNFDRSSWFYTKMKPFFSPFLKFHFPPYFFMICFRDIYNPENRILKPFSSPFFSIFLFSEKIAAFWNHIPRRFYHNYIFRTQQLPRKGCYNAFFPKNTPIFLAVFEILLSGLFFTLISPKIETIFLAVFSCFILIHIVLDKMKPFSSPFSSFYAFLRPARTYILRISILIFKNDTIFLAVFNFYFHFFRQK